MDGSGGGKGFSCQPEYREKVRGGYGQEEKKGRISHNKKKKKKKKRETRGTDAVVTLNNLVPIKWSHTTRPNKARGRTQQKKARNS